jgi:hypothetical protein
MLSFSIDLKPAFLDENIIKVAGLVFEVFSKVIIEFKLRVSFGIALTVKYLFEYLREQLNETDHLLVDSCEKECDAVSLYE